MKNKLIFTIMLALLAGLLVNSAALAQAPQPERFRNSGRRSVGQVTAIGADQFTATTRNDKSYQVLVDENTRFQHSDQSEASFEDLANGQWVVVIAAPRLGESTGGRTEFTARLVVLLPEEIDPAQRFGIRTRGVITGANLAASTFEVRDLNGQILTLAVDENTQFLGQVEGLSDLQPGMNVAAAARADSQGYPRAIIVAARFPLANHAGKITTIDSENGTFSLETVRNGTLTFQVDDQTRFRGPNQSIQGLEDLQPDMLASVVARLEGGDLVALLVVAADRSDLPRFDQRAIGRVVAIGRDRFEIEKPSGEQISLLVTTETRFRSPAGSVQNLEELRKGMRVVVGANEVGGSYQAMIVVVRSR